MYTVTGSVTSGTKDYLHGSLLRWFEAMIVFNPSVCDAGRSRDAARISAELRQPSEAYGCLHDLLLVLESVTGMPEHRLNLITCVRSCISADVQGVESQHRARMAQ